MDIGVPKEVKNHEYRVGLIPASVKELCARGHQVYVETQAGIGIGFSDDDYIHAGASICATAQDVFEAAKLIIKVKEPQPAECKMLRRHHTLFTFLHLAPDPVQTKGLVDSGAIAIAYETITDDKGGLPLLTPMSEAAGRMAVQVGAQMLEKIHGGSGVLLGGLPGVLPGHAVIIGGGVAGTNAARVALGMGAHVTILDRNVNRLRVLDDMFQGQVTTLYSTRSAIEALLPSADLVVGAVLIVGESAPKIITKDMLSLLKPGSVLVDIAIDQGGCFETSRPTTHEHPSFIEEGIVHYCVTNMPGAVARTSAMALNNATLPYIFKLADKGAKDALLEDEHFMNGLNVCAGHVTHSAVAKALEYTLVAGTVALDEMTCENI